jgi:hypothetical protein
MVLSRLTRLTGLGLSALLVFVLAFGSGCDESDTSTGTAEARLQLLLTDAPFPFDLVAEANVTITEVTMKGGGNDSVLVADAALSFNLLDLRNGVTAPLADIEVAAGTYNQLRIQVADSAFVLLNDGAMHGLKIPSGSQSGIKVQLGNLELQDGDLAQVTVDFDVEDSFVVQGNPDTPAGIKGFIFKPVIRAMTVEINGEDVAL